MDSVITRRRWILFASVQLTVVCLLLGAAFFRAFLDHFFSDGSFSFCPVHDFLHLYCPLCGGTRAMLSLCRGDILLSLHQNPLSALLAVSFLFYDCLAAYRIARRKETILHISRKYVFSLLIFCLIFCIIRNILLLYGHDPLGDLYIYWHS